MRAVVAYESIPGARAVARAVGDGLRGRFSVLLTEVQHLPALVGVDLLVVGGPSHGTEYLGALPDAPGEVAAAAFHTAVRRTAWLALTSHAWEPSIRRLESLGYRVFVRPEHFYVIDFEGPPEPGELERAHAWGIGIADACVVRSSA
jgi:hypothetical protein